MRSFCHDVAVFPQPVPHRNPGGDCFACALTAGLRHLYGEKAPTFDQVWECFLVEQEWQGQKTTHLRNIWPGYRIALNAASEYVGRMDVFADLALAVPTRWNSIEEQSWSWATAIDEQAWARRLDAYLRAGYLAFASIKLDATPTGEWHATSEGPRRHATDHFVLLDGLRSGWRKHPTVEGASSWVDQVHVVCSARGGRMYWIDVDTFLREHGAGAWWLIRPGDPGTLVEEVV